MKRCNKYKVDATQPKIYQFFDLPFYDTIDKSSLERSSCLRSNWIPSDDI